MDRIQKWIIMSLWKMPAVVSAGQLLLQTTHLVLLILCVKCGIVFMDCFANLLQWTFTFYICICCEQTPYLRVNESLTRDYYGYFPSSTCRRRASLKIDIAIMAHWPSIQLKIDRVIDVWRHHCFLAGVAVYNCATVMRRFISFWRYNIIRRFIYDIQDKVISGFFDRKTVVVQQMNTAMTTVINSRRSNSSVVYRAELDWLNVMYTVFGDQKLALLGFCTTHRVRVRVWVSVRVRDRVRWLKSIFTPTRF